MKKYLFLISCLALMVSAATAKSFVIKGVFHGDVEGKTVYLLKQGTDKMSRYRPPVIDSTVIQNGKFQFKGKLTEPSKLILKYFPNDNRGEMEPDGRRMAMRPVLPLYIDGGKINVEAYVDSLPLDFDALYYGTCDYKGTKITGSPMNDLYREYILGFTERNDKVSEISMDFSRRYYNSDTRMPMDEIVKALDAQKAAKQAECDFIESFIARNGNNPVGLLALNEQMSRFDKAGIERLLTLITPKMRQTTLGQETLDKANTIKATATGAHFADVTLSDPQDNKHQLSEYLGKGNYTLLEFWASWCGPCRGSIPHLKQLYGLYHPQGFDIVSVSMDDKKENWKKALGEENMKWTQLCCDDGFGKVAETYNFDGIPYCVLIGPNGDIVETNCRDARLDRQLVKHYGNKLESLHIVADIDTQKDTLTLITVPFGSSTMESKKYPVSNGHLDLTLPLESPVQMSIMEPGNYMAGISFPGMPGEEVVVKGSIRDHTISGSNFYTDYAEVQRLLAPYTKQLTEKRIEIEQLWADLGLRDNTVKGKQKVKNQKIYDEAKETYRAEIGKLYNQQTETIIRYIKEHPRQETAITLLSSVPTDSIESLAKGINRIVANGRMKPAIDALKKQAENEQMRKAAKDAIKEGVQAPDFTLDDINGKPLTLSSLRGKWVILDFWGSWCGWCIKGMPAMKEYYKKYSGKFEIIGVDCRDTVEKWKAAVEKHELPWLHVYNKAADGTPEKYGVEGYPTKIIIDPQGNINKIVIGEDESFYQYLDQLFK